MSDRRSGSGVWWVPLLMLWVIIITSSTRPTIPRNYMGAPRPMLQSVPRANPAPEEPTVRPGPGPRIHFEKQWIVVTNETPVRSGNGTFEKGHDCLIGFPGFVQRVDKVVAGKKKFSHYIYFRDGVAYGTSCPSGVTFDTFLPSDRE